MDLRRFPRLPNLANDFQTISHTLSMPQAVFTAHTAYTADAALAACTTYTAHAAFTA